MKLFDKLFKSSNELVEIATQYLFGLNGKDVNLSLAHQYFVLAAKKGNANAINTLNLFFKPDTNELTTEMKYGFEAFRQLRLAVEAGDPTACFLYGVGKLNTESDDYMYHKGLNWVKHSAVSGYAPAMHAYGLELLKGERIPQDKKLGIQYLKEAADKGHMESIRFLYIIGETNLASIYAEKFAKQDNPEALLAIAQIKFNDKKIDEAISYYEKAAELGNSTAMYNLGVIYENDTYQVQDPYLAAAWYKRAAEAGETQAMVNLGYMLQKGPEELRNEKAGYEWYVKAAENGLNTAWNDVAICFKYGCGVDQSFDKALNFFTKAIDSDSPEKAYYNLYRLYWDGIATKPDINKAMEWLKKAAEKGLPEGCFYLGIHYKLGIGVENDINHAYRWINIAAEKGNPSAIYELGEMYLNGIVVEQNNTKAFECFSKASTFLPQAMDRLGQCYTKGIGCTQDYTKALSCYLSAAEAGNVEALFDLGVCYRHGEGVPTDIDQAIEWYEKAIAQGHTGAMVNYAILLDNGIGVEQDSIKAYHLYKEAANANNYDAQFCLGSMYFQGRVVEQDYREAVKWFHRAAMQGEPDSMFHLSFCYKEGLGVTQNITKAIELLYAAADRGWQPAINMIKENNIARPK